MGACRQFAGRTRSSSRNLAMFAPVCKRRPLHSPCCFAVFSLAPLASRRLARVRLADGNGDWTDFFLSCRLLIDVRCKLRQWWRQRQLLIIIFSMCVRHCVVSPDNLSVPIQKDWTKQFRFSLMMFLLGPNYVYL